jgi:hypothetical protein
MAVLGGKGPLLLLFGLLFAAAAAEDGDADPLYRWVPLPPLPPLPEIPSAAISSLVVTTVRDFGLVLGFSFQLGRAVHSYSLLILFLARNIDSLTFVVLLQYSTHC